MGRQDWETPDDFFQICSKEFGPFTLDAAATDYNYKCPRYYTPEVDAHKQNPTGETIWCNPPYGSLAPWIHTFICWSEHNKVVALLPCSVSPGWFGAVVHTADLIYFLTPRINFVGTETGNRADSVLAVWQSGVQSGPAELFPWNWNLRKL